MRDQFVDEKDRLVGGQQGRSCKRRSGTVTLFMVSLLPNSHFFPHTRIPRFPSSLRVSPMSSTLKTDDIFNIADDGDYSDTSNDSEEENERKITVNTFLSTKGSTKAASKGKNTMVYGLNGDSDDEESDQDDEDTFSQDEKGSGKSSTPTQPRTFDPRFAIKDDNNEMEKTPRIRGTKKSKKVKPLTPEALEKFQAARDKTGIVYLSKIPPFMKPIKIRHLLGKFGEIGRVYLAPEGRFQHKPKVMEDMHIVGQHTKMAG
jgi:hypothetical protein